ncbi:hypothetical protein EG68_01843 [Paragonimus skrjabini miyazakii]|uniref:Uncharacterized protein n=1 Tax=Paragonimus skrjabini miyazakii TaxID=59628 RepID=A0A8S9Z5M8_9TREM|nr:hypothetical protein EG68_01843 [Paragonimus skrjabini miyazakii]
MRRLLTLWLYGPLDDVDRWKASKYRQVLLYIGLVCLKEVLDAKMYEKFLRLSACMYALCNSQLPQHYLSFVHRTLIKTVDQFAALYGEGELVFNVHNVVHLCYEVILRGSMDAFSAVPYESYLSTLETFDTLTNVAPLTAFPEMCGKGCL